MKKTLIAFLLCTNLFSQVGIGTETPNNSAILDLTSSNKGFLPTRINLLSNTDFTTIPRPATGLMVYHTGNTNFPAGYYYFNGTEWAKFVDFVADSKSQGSSIVKQRLVEASPNIVITTLSGIFSFRFNGTEAGPAQWQIRYNGQGTRTISSFIVENWSRNGQSAQFGSNTLTSNTWSNIDGGTQVGTVNELNTFRFYDNTDGRIIRFEGILINSNGTKEAMILEEF
ncbi:hypothetical protein SAMN05443634_105243 [Chishuiella changwenlii]|uniref:Uncharacterized protein n=1 Tax=Chishuiella changwenlii TaxID=1434701 RepID=A0A1M6XGS0_9FLAO|nr:hypothetical protein [Chishuiella changwenlii]GGF00814.1 hypothetical protein GCM10010984_17950 [Chishuiella changwenlii]SHL05141.1 hypothetical protein SAMN05443634_105243 [Chishuiella changwenlii]